MTSPGFRAAYDRWDDLSFPRGSKIDELDELHADLAYVDAIVAECAIPYATDGHGDRPPEEAVKTLDRLLERAAELEQHDDPDVARVAASYREYAGALKAVVDTLP